MTKNQKTIDSYIENSEEATKLFGVKDQYLHVIEQLLDVSVVSRGAEIYVTGEEQNIQTADQLFALLLKQIRMGQEIHERDIMYIIRMLRIGKPFDMDQLFSCVILRNTQGRLIRPKTFGQRNYERVPQENRIPYSDQYDCHRLAGSRTFFGISGS